MFQSDTRICPRSISLRASSKGMLACLQDDAAGHVRSSNGIILVAVVGCHVWKSILISWMSWSTVLCRDSILDASFAHSLQTGLRIVS